MNVNDLIEYLETWDGDMPVAVARNENGAVVWDAIQAISWEDCEPGPRLVIWTEAREVKP